MLTNWSRTRIIDAIRGEFRLARALQATGLKRGTYYYERGVITAGDKYAVLRARVAGLFEKGGRVWRYRYLHRMLRLDETAPLVVSGRCVCVASSSTSIETISVNSGTRSESRIIVVVPVIGGILADQALDITCEYQYRKPLQTSTMHRDNTVLAKCLPCQLGVRGCML